MSGFRPPVIESEALEVSGLAVELLTAAIEPLVQSRQVLETFLGDTLVQRRPEAFSRLQLRAVSGQKVKMDAFRGTLQPRAHMPARPID